MTTNQVGPLVAGRDEEKVTGAERSGARPGRDPRVVRLEPRLLLGGAVRRRRSRTSSRRVAGARCSSSSAGRGTAPAGSPSAAVGALLARLHLDHSRQLVRRGRDGGQPLLPEPAARLPVPRPRPPGVVGGRGGRAVGGGLPRRRCSSRRSATRCGRATTRPGPRSSSSRPSSRCSTTSRVFTETWRKKRPFGFVGNPQRPADPDAYFLYFMDDGTFGKEEWAGRAGFWLRGGASAEVVATGVRPRPGRARRPARGRRTARRHGDGAPRLAVGARVTRGPGRVRRDRAPRRARRFATTTPTCTSCGSSRAAARRSPTAAWSVPSWTLRLVMGPRFASPMSERRRAGRPRRRLRARPAGRVAIDLPRASDGRFWSDGATYHAMAGSLAFDGDLEFGAADLARVRASYPGGPQGVFLKRIGVDSGTPRLVYAKALVYPAAAAPLVRLLGVDRGLLRPERARLRPRPLAGLRRAAPRRRGRASAAAGALAVLAGGVVPVYLLWETPEIFNLALATFGLVAWRRGRSGSWRRVLLGLAAYSKPTNLALALPLLLEPLVAGGAATWAKRAVESAAARGRGGGGRGRGLRPDLGRDRRDQLPGRRAQDVLRPLSLRPRRDLRLRRRVDDDRPPGPARRRPRRGQARPRASRRPARPRSCGGPSS